MDFLTIFIKLGLAFFVGALIGFERERAFKQAGLRTHMLVALGSTIFAALSLHAFSGVNVDNSRIASQIVVGIGFLGAGTIFREGNVVRGLTTASSLWVVASLGTAIGLSQYPLAISGAIVTFIILEIIAPIEKKLFIMPYFKKISVVTEDTIGQLGKISQAIADFKIDISNVEMEKFNENKIEILFTVRMSPEIKIDEVLKSITNINGVEKVKIT